MRSRRAARRLQAISASALVLVAVAACGGVTQFSDKASISILGTPPPPPVEPPPAKAMRVEMRDNKIVINEKIQFSYNDSEILEVSFSLLDEVADAIKKNPHVKKLEVGGHASSEGEADYNLRLSQARAEAVRLYLIGKGGVAAERLTSQGYGETQLLANPEETDADRERNRRVEFNIVEQDVTQKRVEVDPDTGDEKVVDSQTTTEKKQEVANTKEEL